MVQNVVMVAAGGALGAVARYGVGIAVMRVAAPGFPLGVLTVNVVGSFLMGLFVGLAAHRGLAHLSPLIATGFLGGFTTFSSFSLEAVTLWQRGEAVAAGAYVGLSVALSIAGLVAGLLLTRAVLA